MYFNHKYGRMKMTPHGCNTARTLTGAAIGTLKNAVAEYLFQNYDHSSSGGLTVQDVMNAVTFPAEFKTQQARKMFISAALLELQADDFCYVSKHGEWIYNEPAD
jgi:hypothetical protein